MARGGVRTRRVFMNGNRRCNCGECRICKYRDLRHRWYERNKELTYARTVESRAARKERKALEASDDELDRKALEWLERNR